MLYYSTINLLPHKKSTCNVQLRGWPCKEVEDNGLRTRGRTEHRVLSLLSRVGSCFLPIMVIFLIDSQIAVLSWEFYQNGKKKNKKKNEPMEAAELFRQHCSKGFSGQGTFRRLEEKNQDTFYRVLFSHPEFKGKALGTKNCAVIN